VSSYALFPKTSCEALGCLSTAVIAVRIKGHIDGSEIVAQLPKLARVEMGSQRTGDVLKSGLPQHGVVE